MASNFFRSTATLLVTFSVLSIAIAFVVDIDGEPLLNGQQYYIVPHSIGFGGGLTLKSKSAAVPCPYYIAQGEELSPGIPVTITTPFKIGFIPPSVPISLVFKDTMNICMQPLGWQVIPDGMTRQSYVATGGSGNPLNPMEAFSIEESGENNMYTIRYIAEKRDIGFFAKDGLLGITSDIPLPVQFRKAFDVLAMKV